MLTQQLQTLENDYALKRTEADELAEKVQIYEEIMHEYDEKENAYQCQLDEQAIQISDREQNLQDMKDQLHKMEMAENQRVHDEDDIPHLKKEKIQEMDEIEKQNEKSERSNSPSQDQDKNQNDRKLEEDKQSEQDGASIQKDELEDQSRARTKQSMAGSIVSVTDAKFGQAIEQQEQIQQKDQSNMIEDNQ